MAVTAMWAHGTTLSVESPDALALIGHTGIGKKLIIRENKGSWFHAPVPTPVIIADQRAKLLRAFLLFSIGPANHGNIADTFTFSTDERGSLQKTWVSTTIT